MLNKITEKWTGKSVNTDGPAPQGSNKKSPNILDLTNKIKKKHHSHGKKSKKSKKSSKSTKKKAKEQKE